MVYGTGDYSEQPWRLRPWQNAILHEALRLNPNGSRRWRRIVLLIGSGNGKTALGGVIGDCEFAGPAAFAGVDEHGQAVGKMRVSPEIPVAATSFNQADKLFSAASTSLSKGALGEFFDFYDTEIVFNDGRAGRLFRVAAVQGGNEGENPSALLYDETHELKGSRKRVRTVLAKGMAKRSDATAWEFSTAGVIGQDSLAEDSWKLWRAIGDGTTPEGETLIINYEAAEHWNLDDADELREALLEANPAAGDFLDLSNLIAHFHDPAIPLIDFERYHLNRWKKQPLESWLKDRPGAWEACAEPALVFPDGDTSAEVTAGVDMALRNDSMALTFAARMPDGRRAVRARVWTAESKGRLPHDEMRAELRAASLRWPRLRVAYDPRFFESMAQDLAEEGLCMVEVPQVEARMAPACRHMYELIGGRDVVHDGDPVLADHVNNAVRRDGERGWTLSKRKSGAHIDACISTVLALFELDSPANVEEPEEEPMTEEQMREQLMVL